MTKTEQLARLEMISKESLAQCVLALAGQVAGEREEDVDRIINHLVDRFYRLPTQ